MAETIPPLSVSQQKDIRVVEFTNNRILDEANIAEIGDGLAALIEERTNPKLLLDFATVDHLSSAALGMLINVNKQIREERAVAADEHQAADLRGVRDHEAEQAVPHSADPRKGWRALTCTPD